MKGRRGLGAAGEKLAWQHLAAQGYTLLDANWHGHAGELDLVAREGDTIVFVEVRTRRGDDRGTPEESVTASKQARLIRLAEEWMSERYPDELPEWRIDVVGVHLTANGRLIEINHLQSAVEAG